MKLTTELNKTFQVNPSQLNILRNALDYYKELHDEIVRSPDLAFDVEDAREVRDTCEQILTLLRTE